MTEEDKKDGKVIEIPDDHKIIDPDPKADVKKQWVATTGLRMKKFVKGIQTPQGIQMVPMMMLQQLFQNQVTAELEWRNVPIVDEQNQRVEMN